MAIYVYPPVSLSITSGPVAFLKDGVNTTVSQDTGTPASSEPLPVKILSSIGVVVDPATAAKQDVSNAHLQTIEDNSDDMVTYLNGINNNTSPLNAKENLFKDYSATNVGAGAFVTMIAATGFATKKLTWFESGGYAMILAIGAAGVEVPSLYIPPGGFNGEIELNIPAGARVSLKCLQAVTVNLGIVVANLIG